MGIEPTRPAWKAGILPLNYTRISAISSDLIYFSIVVLICQEKFLKIYNLKEKKAKKIELKEKDHTMVLYPICGLCCFTALSVSDQVYLFS